MKNNVPHKRMIKPDVGYNIQEHRCHLVKRNRHYNDKKFWLNVFNRRLRRVLNVFIRKDEQ